MSQDRIYDLLNFSANGVSLKASDDAAATLTGDSFDARTIEGTASVLFNLGDVSGSPTAVSAVCSVEESDDGSTGWSAVATQTTLTLDAAGESGFVRVDHAKPYLRAKIVLSFTAGSSPKAVTSANILGSKRRSGTNASGIDSSYPA